MRKWAYFDSSGRITKTETRPDGYALSGSDEEAVEVGNAVTPRDHYIETATQNPLSKKSMAPSVSTSVGTVEITGLPDPCEIRWGQQSAEATGGTATVTFDEPGTYTLTLRAEPVHLEHTLEVEIP